MIPRHMHRFVVRILLCAVPLLVTACEKVPLTAPTGSTITLTTATSTLPINGTATIVAQVIEAGGTPPHSGTAVLFTTSLGTIEPADASTDASGRAVVTFHAGNASGLATIAASSGGATTSNGTTSTSGTTGTTTGTTTTSDRNIRIAVGAAAVGRVILAANPAVLPTVGGVASITASVIDLNGNALSNAPVTFTTTAGTLSASVISTDASGIASVSLTTVQDATVTASVGAAGSSGTGGTTTQTGSNNQATVTVSLTGAPSLSITVPTTPPSAGLPASYTFTVSAGSGGGTTSPSPGTTTTTTVPATTSPRAVAMKSLDIDWGDGGPIQSLGAVTGTQAVSHTYASPRTYTITATAMDVAGGSARVSTTVAVIQAPPPTINISYSPVPAKAGTQVTFTVQITAPQGLSIVNATINFGDGGSAGLGGGSTSSQPHTYVNVGTYTVTVTVTDTSGQTTTGFTSVSVGM
jgi:hypothetical protein